MMVGCTTFTGTFISTEICVQVITIALKYYLSGNATYMKSDFNSNCCANVEYVESQVGRQLQITAQYKSPETEK